MSAFKGLFAGAFQRLTPQSLQGRLRCWGILLIIVPSVLMTVAFAIYEFADERNQAFKKMEQSVSLQRQAITMWAKNKGTKIRTLSLMDSVRRLDKNAMALYFKSALDADSTFNDIIFVNKYGNIDIDMKNSMGADVSYKEYFKRAIKGEHTAAEIIRLEATGELRVVFASPVYDYNEQFQGVVVGVMPFSAIDAVMGEFTVGRTDDTFLVDKTGMRFTLPRYVREGDAKAEGASCYLQASDSYAVKSALQGNSGVATYNNCRGESVIGSYQWISKLNFAIISEINESEVLEPVYKQIANMLLLFLLILVAVLPITILMAENIRRPIKFLLSGSESIKKLEYTYRIDDAEISSAPHELRQLCATFNQMADTINEHRSQLEEKVKKRTYALRNAINRLKRQIIARRKMEISLQQSEEKYRLLFTQATDAILLTEATNQRRPGRFIEVNDKACELLGYNKEELLTLTPFDIDSKLKEDKGPKDFGIEQYKNIVCESIYEKKSGEAIPVEMNVHLIPLQGRPVYLNIFRDISVRRKLEQEMARLERLNLVGEMAASIGHEVRNPMTTVRGFLQMLGRKTENSHNDEYFKLMIEELDRANSIISEFLSLAKNKSVDLKMQSINNIIDALYPLLQADAIINGKEIKLGLGEIPQLKLDEKEIRQLILNLVRNGLEAMPQATKLLISTFTEEDEVVLAIKDQGTGIPPEILDRLGTPFLTTKENGTGLGLAVCYSIANRHNAVVVPQTGPEGTTFFVRFKIS